MEGTQGSADEVGALEGLVHLIDPDGVHDIVAVAHGYQVRSRGGNPNIPGMRGALASGRLNQPQRDGKSLRTRDDIVRCIVG